MVDILCLQIKNKVTGNIVTVPLATWENGLHKDPDWSIYKPPKPPKQPLAPPVKIDLKPPPPPPTPVIKKVKEKAAKPKAERKGR